jgi:MFS family permease
MGWMKNFDLLASAMQSKHTVGWLSLGQLISWGSIFYTFALIMVPIERELNISRAQSSVAFSLALLVEGFLAYPVGRLIDRGYERAVMSGGSLLAGVCLVLHSQVSGIVGFYAVWAGLGAAMAAVLYSPVFAVVTRRFPGNFRRAIITLTFLGGLASTVFLPLTAWLISVWGWRSAMVCLAIFHIAVCFPLHIVVLKEAPKPLRIKVKTDGKPRKGFDMYIWKAPFLLIASFMVLMMAVTAALPAHMVSLLRENGLDETWVIAIPASIGVIQVLGRLLLYFFEHHFDLDSANRVIPLLIPIGLGFLLLAPMMGDKSVWAVLFFILLFGLGNGMITIVKGTAIAQYVSQENVASLNGVLGVPIALARASAPLMLGLLWSPTDGYSNGISVLIGLSVVGVVALACAQKIALRRNCHTDV